MCMSAIKSCTFNIELKLRVIKSSFFFNLQQKFTLNLMAKYVYVNDIEFYLV